MKMPGNAAGGAKALSKPLAEVSGSFAAGNLVLNLDHSPKADNPVLDRQVPIIVFNTENGREFTSLNMA